MHDTKAAIRIISPVVLFRLGNLHALEFWRESIRRNGKRTPLHVSIGICNECHHHID